MIQDLRLALDMHSRCGAMEFVVAERVFEQVLKFPNRGSVWVQLNTLQEGFRYRYLSRIQWRGLLFIHPSQRPVSLDSGMGVYSLSETGR